MTDGRAPVDDLDTLRRILADTEALLLDFDGPVCSVFAGFPAPVVADQLRDVLADGGHKDLPREVQKTDDPFDVLRYANILGRAEAEYVEAALRAHEVEAVASAQPTPGAHDLITSWRKSGRKIAIVSNNSVAAVESYLGLHFAGQVVDEISARESSDYSLLKPNAYLIQKSTKALNINPQKATLVGDSSSDGIATLAAGSKFIGFANKPGKTESLSIIGTAALITDICNLESAL